MSDTLDHIDPQALANAQLFAWQVLQTLDLVTPHFWNDSQNAGGAPH
jgi:hypothetical protein